jgi:hypothetical protein
VSGERVSEKKVCKGCEKKVREGVKREKIVVKREKEKGVSEWRVKKKW